MKTPNVLKSVKHHVNKRSDVTVQKVHNAVEKIKLWLCVVLIGWAPFVTSCGTDSAEVKLAKAQVEQAQDALDKAEDYARSVEKREEAEEDLRQAKADLEDAQEKEKVDKKIMNGDLE